LTTARESLSVIVTTYDGRELLAECLPALAVQTRPPDEVLVVDDASPQDDARWTRERFPWAQALRLQRNLGHAGAAAAGLAHARGTFVALLNNDAAPDPDWCEQATLPLADPGVGSVATRLVLHDAPELIDSAGDAYTVVGGAYKRLEGRSDPLEQAPRAAFSACAAAVVYRRSSLEACGGFDPALEAYYDDVDVGFRLRLAGWRCVYQPAARCRHRVSASYGRGSWRQLALTSRNAAWVYWSNMPARLLLRHLPEHALFFALQCLSRAAQGGLAPFLAGKLLALRGLPELARRRARAQALRRTSVRELSEALDAAWLRHSIEDLSRHHRRGTA
jgi:GT2 family glycosyltransferase